MAKAKNKRSFTLMELLITTVILLLVLGSLLYTFTYCMILNEQNSNLATAYNDAQEALEEMKAIAFGNISTTYVAPTPTNLYAENITVYCNGAACASLPSGASLAQVDVVVTWIERGRARSETVSTAIAESVD
jgi:type II secretory pathway pseudopilin PulG